MNTDPDDNENPNRDDANKNTPISHEDSLDRKIASVARPTDIGPNDVLCGRSKSSFNHGVFKGRGLTGVFIWLVHCQLSTHFLPSNLSLLISWKPPFP